MGGRIKTDGVEQAMDRCFGTEYSLEFGGYWSSFGKIFLSEQHMVCSRCGGYGTPIFPQIFSEIFCIGI